MLDSIKSQGVVGLLLCASAVVNIGLGHKLKTQRDVIRGLANSRHAEVLGAPVDHLDVLGLDGSPTVVHFSKSDAPTLIYVFRPDCGWCARNLPNLKALEASASTHNFHIIGISTDDHGLKDYIGKEHLDFPIYSNLRSDERLRLDMGGTPQTLLIANGAVVRNWEGAYTEDLKKEVESTLGITLPGVLVTDKHA